MTIPSQSNEDHNPNRSAEKTRRSREIHLTMFDQNPAFTNPANSYVLASLALARSHHQNDSVDRSAELAEETIERAASFPESLKANQVFVQNMAALRKFLPSSSE